MSRRFDPYSQDKEKRAAARIKEMLDLRLAYARSRPENGSTEAAIASWKAGQSRKKKVPVSLAPVKFLDDDK